MILFQEKYYPDTSISNISASIVTENITVPLLEKALNIYLSGDISMHMRITEGDGEVQQYFTAYEWYPMKVHVSDDKESAIKMAEDLHHLPIPYLDNCLFDIRVIAYSGGYNIFAKMHHILADGFTLTEFFNKVFSIYNLLSKGEDVQYTCQPYTAFIEKEKSYLESTRFSTDREFWNTLYSDVPEFIEMDGVKEQYDYKASRTTYQLDDDADEMVRAFCKEHKISFFNLFLTGFNLYLHKLTSKNDISISTSIFNRDKKQMDIAGMCINIIPLRTHIKDVSVLEFLLMIQRDFMAALKHSKYPQQLIVNDYKKRTGCNQSMFSINFTYQNARFYLDDILGSYDYIWHGYTHRLNTLELNVSDRRDNKNLLIIFDYLTDLFDSIYIKRFYEQYMQVVLWMIKHPQTSVNKAEIISKKESDMILNKFNQTARPYYDILTLDNIFSDTVKIYPNRIALRQDDITLTYEEMNQRVNQMARVLKEMGVGPDVIVPIVSRRSIEMMIGIYGIIRAGGAYLPLDVDMPEERMAYVLKDSKAKILLTDNKKYIDKVGSSEILVLYLSQDTYAGASHNYISSETKPSNLAYIIYTSGSTGEPKGVMIEHQAIVNRLLWMQEEIPLNEDDLVLFKTPYTFDVSVVEVFWWMFSGSSAYILPSGQEKDPEAMIEVIDKEQITYIHFVPPMLNVFLDYVEVNSLAHRVKSLLRIVASGEALDTKQVAKFWHSLYSLNHTKLYNFYGPTEAAVDVSYYECFLDNKEETELIPIGKPIANTRLYILNECRQMQPIGVTGELYIAGKNVGRGYLNALELTEQKFVPDLIHPNEKMYRTGDLAQWQASGYIRYVGRMDSQVKIRGYRIEIGDIESQLINLSYIDKAIVSVIQKKEKMLVCHFTSSEQVDIDQLKKDLYQKLPDYMIPSFFLQLDAMPMNKNGKIDRKQLPSIELTEKKQSALTDLTFEQKLLVDAWSKILGGDISIYDNFFQIGGDSIKAIQIINVLQKSGYKLNVRDFFEGLTVDEIVTKMVRIKQSGEKKSNGCIPLLPIQRWFFEYRWTRLQCSQFNQYMTFCISGTLNDAIAKEAMNILTDTHAAFRLRYRMTSESIEQYYCNDDQALFLYESVELPSEGCLESNIIRRQMAFNLEKGPLCSVQHIRWKGNEYITFSIHHLIIDGVSWGMIASDFQQAYKQLQDGSTVELQSSNVYQNWSNYITQGAKEGIFNDEATYWNDNVVPLDKSVGIIANPNRHHMEVCLPIETTSQLQQQVYSKSGIDVTTLLIAALGVTVFHVLNEDLYVNLEMHGRSDEHSGLEFYNTVGWFTAQFPLHIKLRDKGIDNALKMVKQKMDNLPRGGIGYGALRYNTNILPPHATPNICFNYLGSMDLNDVDGMLKNLMSYSGLSTSKMKGMFPMELNLFVSNNQLTILVDYEQSIIDLEVMEQFMDLYQSQIQEMVEYCIDSEQYDLSIKFTNATLDEYDFTSIMGQLSKISG